MKSILLTTLLLTGLLLSCHPHASPEEATNWTTKINSAGGVTITATFVNPEDIWGPGYQTFYVQLESVTANLDNLDFEKDIVLRDDNGWTYLPKMVQAGGSGGHREAVLRFLKSRSQVEFVELVVRRYETVFKWWSMITDAD